MESNAKKDNPEEDLKSIFITDQMYKGKGDFVEASKYSRSFNTLEAFLDYLGNHNISIDPILNMDKLVPENFNDILAAGFPFETINSYREYVSEATRIFSPIFLISAKYIPCDFIELSEDWQTNKEGIKFNCFIRHYEMMNSNGKKNNWSDAENPCPKSKYFDSDLRNIIKEKGKPCDKSENYFKDRHEFIGAVETLFNTFKRIRKTRIIPLTRFSGFIDSVLWFYCIGEESIKNRINNVIKNIEKTTDEKIDKEIKILFNKLLLYAKQLDYIKKQPI